MKDLSHSLNMTLKQEICMPKMFINLQQQEKLDSHLNDCKAKKPTRVTFSDKEKLEFTNTERQIKHAFVIYADFESTLEKIQTCEAKSYEFIHSASSETYCK